MPDEPHDIEWDDNGQPRSTAFGDYFYSATDGRAETVHVFLHGNNLPERWKSQTQFHIAELGFGTGLNAVETWSQWIASRTADQHLIFTSFEAFPMNLDEMKRALSQWPALDEQANALTIALSNGEPNQLIALDEQSTLHLIIGDAQQTLPEWNGSADAWYLDGFAPDRNPDIWSAELMQAVYDHTNKGGSFATYTAAGWVRRNLQAVGFRVEKRPGFGSKREMLAGSKP